MNSIAYT